MRIWLSAVVAAIVLALACCPPSSQGRSRTPTCRRSTCPTRSTATSSPSPATRSACCRSRTTTTRAPTRPARPGGESTSTPRGCRPTSSATHINAGALQRLRRLQPGRHDPAQGAGHRQPSPTSAATGAAPINHIGRYRKGDAPVVVLDAATRKRWPIWVEIDSTAASPDNRVLEIHPAVNFASGHRYIVALRNLTNAAGERIEAPGGVPLLPRPGSLRPARDQRPPSALRGHLQAPAEGRHQRALPLPGLGLHRGERHEQRRPRAGDARRRFRPARRHRAGGPDPAGGLARASRSRASKTNRTPVRSPAG